MRARSLLLPVVLAAGFLAGCTAAGPNTPAATTTPAVPGDNGISALPADQIVTKATEALKTAPSFRMKGTLDQGSGEVTYDLVGSGDNFKGTQTIQGLAIEVLKVNGAVYVKADLPWNAMLGAFVQDQSQLEAALDAIKGKYVKLPANEEMFKQYLVVPMDMLAGGGTFTKGGAANIGGTPAITLTNSNGAKLYVATLGEPYPLRFEDKNGNKVDLTEVGGDVTIEAPAAADVIDLTQLAQLGS